MKFTEEVKSDLKRKVMNLHWAEKEDPIQEEQLTEAVDIAIDLLAKTKSWSNSRAIAEKIPSILSDLFEIIEI